MKGILFNESEECLVPLYSIVFLHLLLYKIICLMRNHQNPINCQLCSLSIASFTYRVSDTSLLFVLGFNLLHRSEFVFINPNSKGQCGCGESFMTSSRRQIRVNFTIIPGLQHLIADQLMSVVCGVPYARPTYLLILLIDYSLVL